MLSCKRTYGGSLVPFCSYCKQWVGMLEPRYQCAGCRRIFCQKCGSMFNGVCLICSKIEKLAEKSGLKLIIPA